MKEIIPDEIVKKLIPLINSTDQSNQQLVLDIVETYHIEKSFFQILKLIVVDSRKHEYISYLLRNNKILTVILTINFNLNLTENYEIDLDYFINVYRNFCKMINLSPSAIYEKEILTLYNFYNPIDSKPKHNFNIKLNPKLNVRKRK